MATEYLTTDIDLKKVADGIRSRTGKTTPLAFPDGYVTEISTLTNTSDATAKASDIAEGKTAYVKGAKVTGSLVEVKSGSTWQQNRTSKGPVGNTKVVFRLKLNTELVFRNGSTCAITVPLTDFGNATAGEILKGKTCTSAAGLNIAGTMPNNGAAAIQLSDLTAKPVTAGYYSGGTAKVADAEAAKIIPENIKKGVTILGVTGTMEASAGGDYNIAATTNADGTQNLAITDAAGGGGGGGSGQQLVNLTITVDPTNAPDEWSLYIYSTHGDEVVLDANNLVSTIPNCIVGGIFAIDASRSADPVTRTGYLDQDVIFPSCVNCFFDIIGNASGFISSNDRYPVYVCQIDPDAVAGSEATMTLKFN